MNVNHKTYKTMKAQTTTEDPTKYDVIKFYRVSGRREILRTNLTREEAQRVVNSYPDSSRSLVGFSAHGNYKSRKRH